MIASVRGILQEKRHDRAIIDVGGVGFNISIPLSTFRQLPDVGESALVHTVLAVREDDLRLFGFATLQERDLFAILTQVQGIGLKMGLDILSTFSPERFAAAVQAADHVSLCRIPGVGKKRAERLIFDLKGNEALLALGRVVTTPTEEKDLPPREGTVFEEAVEALMALGCKPNTAHRAVTEATGIVGRETTLEILIKEALKHR
jgi:Holliday junction DNA helicase RuvA